MIEIIYLTFIAISFWFFIFFFLRYLESFVNYYLNHNENGKDVVAVNRFWLTVFTTLLIYMIFFV